MYRAQRSFYHEIPCEMGTVYIKDADMAFSRAEKSTDAFPPLNDRCGSYQLRFGGVAGQLLISAS